MWRVIGVVGLWSASLVAQQEPPVFRTDISGVTVNVAVKKGNSPVLGLTASDFNLYDNDVPQELTAIARDAVPVDVSMVVDTSGSAFPNLGTAREAMGRMIGFLRPSDRVRVLTMENAVVNAVPWTSRGNVDLTAIALAGGAISLIADSVLIAMLHRSPPDRRHLVVALTDGDDVCSLTSGESLRQGAQRSGAVLHWIKVQFSGRENKLRMQDLRELRIPIEDSAGVSSSCRWSGNKMVDVRGALADAVRLTGGTEHVSKFGEPEVMVNAFDKILDDFRSSYLLHYVPRDVESSGWHQLRVEMKTRGLTVRARPGYWSTSATQR